MSQKDWLALFAAALAAFVALMDIQIINSSLQIIESSLGIEFTEGGWISTAYLIAEVVMIPLTSVLIDSLGLKTYLILGSTFFAFSSVLCALSWNLTSIAIFRFLQGLSGGTLIPVIFQMILIYMPKHRRNVGLSIFGLVATMAPTIGTLVGGYISMHYGWRWIFLANIFICSFVILIVTFSFQNTPKSFRILRNADWIGAALICSALASLTFILEEGSNRDWSDDPITVSCMLVTASCLPLFIFWELRKKSNPLLELSLFYNREFAICAAITFIAAQCLYGGMYALSIYLGTIHNYSSLEIGSILAWAGIPQLLLIPFLPLLMRQFDSRALAFIGLLLFAWSNWSNTCINNNYGGPEFRWTLIQRAISQPLFTISLSALAVSNIMPSLAGAASLSINMIRNIGGSVGIALVSYILNMNSLSYSKILASGVNPILPNMPDRINIMKSILFINNIDPNLSEVISLRTLYLQVLRESYFHCFNKIFEILAVELIIAGIMVLFIPRPEAKFHKPNNKLHI